DAGQDDLWHESYRSQWQPHFIRTRDGKAFCEVAFRDDPGHRVHHGRVHGSQTGTARSAGRDAGAAGVDPIVLTQAVCLELLALFSPPKNAWSGYPGLIQYAKVAFWQGEVIMETSALAQPVSDRYPQVAGPIHTILVLAIL